MFNVSLRFFKCVHLGRLVTIGTFLLVAMSGVPMESAAASEDRHVGYYYPKPAQIEVYDARAGRMAQTTRRTRIGFIVGIVEQILQRPFPPPASVFVKGDQAEKMIIVANSPGRLDTIYRVRAYLATLTSVARAMPMFGELQVEDVFTFLDLLKMLGFTQLTVSDGDTFAHQILIK